MTGTTLPAVVRIVDLPIGTTITGAELIEAVQTSNGVGLSVQFSLTQLSTLGAATIVTTGATLITPYAVTSTDTRILLNKTVGATSYVQFPAGTYNRSVMVRDLKGDAATSNIFISFSGSADGLASPITISSPYGGWVLNPLPTGDWYITNT